MELFKVVDTTKAFLAISPKPTAMSLPSEFHTLKTAGVGALISLIEGHEVKELGLELEEVECTRLGIQFSSHPMPDRQPPRDLESFSSTVGRVLDNLDAGRSTVVHCVGGIGRSGLIAAAVLLNLDQSPSEALATVSAARGRAAPDTPAQIEWFSNNAKRLRIDT